MSQAEYMFEVFLLHTLGPVQDGAAVGLAGAQTEPT